jgi:hypothetical protein
MRIRARWWITSGIRDGKYLQFWRLRKTKTRVGARLDAGFGTARQCETQFWRRDGPPYLPSEIVVIHSKSPALYRVYNTLSALSGNILPEFIAFRRDES